MSHVTERTLHRYLNGQLSALEAVELERHLVGCPACRTRLEDERAPSRPAGRTVVPALSSDRAPGPARTPARRRRRPPSSVAWAALAVAALLALGVAWYVRGLGTQGAARGERAAAPTPTMALAPPAPRPDSTPPIASPIRAGAPSASPPPPGPAAPSGPSSAAESAAVPTPAERAASVGAGAPGPSAPASDTGLGGARAGAPATPSAPAAAPTAARPEPDAWQEIGFDDAGRLLGEPFVAIPGLHIRRLVRSRAGGPVIVVEQLVDSGTVVRLYERREPGPAADSAAPPGAGQRVGRAVAGLRVEIEGPLPTDSLTRLLALVR